MGSTAPGDFLRRSHTDYVTDAAYVNEDVNFSSGASLRGLPKKQWVSTDEAGLPLNRASVTAYEYDVYASDSRHAPLVSHQNIIGLCDVINVQNQCVLSSPASLTVRGNLTGATSYSNAAAEAGPVTASKQYDVAGSVVKSIDARGFETQVSYADSFCNDGVRCGYTATPNTFAFPTVITSPVPDLSTLYGFGAGTFGSTQSLTTSTVYDYHSGLTYSTSDANGKATRFEYESQPNKIDRVKATVRPDGGRTDIDYSDVLGNLYVRTLTDLDASRRVESYQFFDGLGRPVRSFLEAERGGPQGWNTLDMTEMRMLDAPANKGELTMGNALAHETLEAYGSAKGMIPDDAHAYATQNFGGFEPVETRLNPAGYSITGRSYGGEFLLNAVKPDGTRVRTKATVEYPKGVRPNIKETVPHKITKVEVIP